VTGEASLLADRSEPLGLWTRSGTAPDAYPDLRGLEFEFSSRGDRVPGRLWLPPRGEGPFPLVLLQHGLWGSREAAYLDTTAGPWARAGVAVASIDFPLHGKRAGAKFAGWLAAGLGPAAGGDPALRSVAVECARQGVMDLQRALDALEGMQAVDASRTAYAGFSLGGMLGATFCSVDPRPRAAALALAGAGLLPPEADPARYLDRVAPRPLLFVNATGDATVPRQAAQALFDAAREPKQMLWFDGSHAKLPGEALKAMWLFLKRHLAHD
jgi:dienelactone hydrolase